MCCSADVVAAEPVEIVPVAHLVFHLGHAFLAVARPNTASGPIDLRAGNLAYHPFLDLIQGLQVAILIVPLQSAYDFKLLLVGHLRRLNDFPYPGAVNGDWLLHENVFSTGHRVFEMRRTETRRRAEKHEIGAVNRLLERIEAMESTFLGDINTLPELLLQRLVCPINFIPEGIRHRNELGSRDVERLGGGTCAPPSAAHQGDLNFLTAVLCGGDTREKGCCGC